MDLRRFATLPLLTLIGCSTPPSATAPTSVTVDVISTLDAAFDAEAQRKLEQQFDSYLNPENLRDWMKHMSSSCLL